MKREISFYKMTLMPIQKIKMIIITPDKFDQEVELENCTVSQGNYEDSSKITRRGE